MKAYGGVLASDLRQDILAATELLCLAFRTILIAVALLAGFKALAMAWVTFLTGLPRLVIYLLSTRRFCPWLRIRRQPWFGPTTRALLSYRFYAFIIKVSDQFRFNLDALVTTTFVGLAAVTHYNIGAILTNYYLQLMIALLSVVRPLFSRIDGAAIMQH